jgi:hypothetical protein
MQTKTSAQSLLSELPASVKVKDLTFYTGRVTTALSDNEAELLHGVLHSAIPKEPLAPAPNGDGFYSYAVGAKDYFTSSHLPARLNVPEQLMVICELDSASALKQIRISDRENTHVYCQAHFEPPAMAMQAPALEQGPSVLPAEAESSSNARGGRGFNPPAPGERPRTNLSLFTSVVPTLSSASTSTQVRALSHGGSAEALMGVSGLSRPHADHAARINAPNLPAPQPRGQKRQRLGGAIEDQIIANLSEQSHSSREVGRDRNAVGLEAGVGHLGQPTGARRQRATQEQILAVLRDPEDNRLRGRKQVGDVLRKAGLRVNEDLVTTLLREAGATRHLKGATDEQIKQHLRDPDTNEFRKWEDIGQSLRDANLGARNDRITRILQKAREEDLAPSIAAPSASSALPQARQRQQPESYEPISLETHNLQANDATAVNRELTTTQPMDFSVETSPAPEPGEVSQASQSRRPIASDEDIKAHLSSPGGTTRNREAVVAAVRNMGLAVGVNRVSSVLQNERGTLQRPGASDALIKRELRGPDGKLRNRRQVTEVLNDLGWGSNNVRIQKFLQEERGLVQLPGASEAEIAANLRDSNGNLRTERAVAQALNDNLNKGASNKRIRVLLQKERDRS